MQTDQTNGLGVPMEQKLSVIMACDVVGCSRLMGIDEKGTLSALKSHRRELLDVRIAEHQGRTIKLIGDGMPVEFRRRGRCPVFN
jgi:adenylate cyclase